MSDETRQEKWNAAIVRAEKQGKRSLANALRDDGPVEKVDYDVLAEDQPRPTLPVIHWSMVEDDGSAMCWEGDYCPDKPPTISTDLREVTCAECRQHYNTLNDLKRAEAQGAAPQHDKANCNDQHCSLCMHWMDKPRGAHPPQDALSQEELEKSVDDRYRQFVQRHPHYHVSKAQRGDFWRQVAIGYARELQRIHEREMADSRARSTPSPDPPKKRAIAKEYVDKQLAVMRKYGSLTGEIQQREYETLIANIERVIVCNATSDSPPQIVSAPDPKVASLEALHDWAHDTGSHASLSEGNAFIDGFDAGAKYASSSNAALQQELSIERVRKEEWRKLREAAESKLKDAANEIHMLERAAESHKYTVSDLVAERDGLREALRKLDQAAFYTIAMIGSVLKSSQCDIGPTDTVMLEKSSEQLTQALPKSDSGARLGTESTEKG